MRDAADELDSRGVEVLGVSFDSVDDNRAFAEKNEFPFKLLCDGERALGMAYHAARTADEGYARRISYLIDADGKILSAYKGVDPRTHLDVILKDLDA